jgi:RES domain-containing protein
MGKRSTVLKVPSAVVPGDFNFLINPHHSEFASISIKGQEDFPFESEATIILLSKL